MIRTVVTFEPAGRVTLVKLDDAPNDVDGIGENREIDLTQVVGETLIERGTSLLELIEQHAPVKAGLAAALAAPPTSEPFPLYFHVRAAFADTLPWEQIYAPPHGFCALDRRWPIGRIAARSRPLNDREFSPPLRVVAVLSAGAQRSGVDQLRVLLDAVQRPEAQALGMALHVISGEQAVLDQAAAHGASAELIAPTGPALSQQIAAAKPHIVHVLCHGGAVGGVRVLAFANLSDFDAGIEFGSVRMSVSQLVGALLPCDPWLVVLCACDTADVTEHNGPALAHDLVCAGIPAVIGMRRLVDLIDTNRFCGALYPELVDVLGRALNPAAVAAGQPALATVDWAEALTTPRQVMGQADPSTVDAWTDPVLYAQDVPLRIFLPTQQLPSETYGHLRAKIDKFQGYLATLDPATTAPGVLDEVRNRILELQAALAPVGPP